MAKDGDFQRRVLVGVAASAGGLEAASLLVKNLPKGANAVYVLAQHMSPTHKSLLTSLISRETKLPVQELTDTPLEPQADTIYITPPNSDVMFSDGKLCLVSPIGHSAAPKPSADRLFKSIADECGAASVGIVLSGTGSDGSYGVQAIRESGGITIAQDAGSAKYDGMPNSAVETGCIDLTLSPEEIGRHLKKILSDPAHLGDLRQSLSKGTRSGELLQILLARTRVDFRDYKETTFNRRVQRRMVALGMDNFEHYVEYCRTSEQEVDSLHRDLLISVTRFFRDPAHFVQLRRELARQFESNDRDKIRIWVAGCATGEEAYTVGAIIADVLGGIDQLDRSRLQVFATDIDERALEVARRGEYPISAANDIPSEFLGSYFQIKAGRIEVVPELRRVMLFSKHNIFQDPPFTELDLATLRNVLIYFNSDLQNRVLARMHYALKTDALLFLGISEHVGPMDSHFETRIGCDKIFAKRAVSRAERSFVSDALSRSQGADQRVQEQRQKNATGDSATEMFDALARSVAQNGFVVSRNYSIVQVMGDVTPMLQLNESTSLSLSIRILRPGLRDEAPSLISTALKNQCAREGRWHRIDGRGFNRVRMVCYPIITSSSDDHVLLAFQTSEEAEISQPVEELSDLERTQYILQIETEMQSTREALQQTVEELQTSNEELLSVNLELQSTNEEFQATNEEMETANEELQSTNEELITVNEEMLVNSAELQTVSTELSAVLAASPNPIIVVDNALMIRRASDSAMRAFQIDTLPSSGVHLSRCELAEDGPNITTVAAQVFRSREEKQIRIQHENRIRKLIFVPFDDSTGKQLGLTISMYDFETLETDRMIDSMARLGDVGSWNYDPVSGVILLSEGIRRSIGLDPGRRSLPLSDAEIMVHPDDREMVRDKIRRSVEEAKSFRLEARLLVQRETRTLHVQVTGTPIIDDEGTVEGFVGAFRDATTELTTSTILDNLERAHLSNSFGLYSHDVDNGTIFLTLDAGAVLGIDSDDKERTIGKLVQCFEPSGQTQLRKSFKDLVARGGEVSLDLKLQQDGKPGSDCMLTAVARTRADGSVSHIYGSVRLKDA